MVKSRLKIPVKLVIAIVIIFVLGVAANPLVQAVTTPEQLATNVILAAIPFILIFVSIILTFILIINMVASVLDNHIGQTLYKRIESIIIAGIVFGVFSLFQPWLFVLYKNGFMILLVSTLSFILWSHIVPKSLQRQEDLESDGVNSGIK
ncbi:MAG TPA: hypothetical protein DCY42_13245 [Chloroflexi bacterium]|nr:hypothetical protein [Chloroflexota bacterium]